MCLCRRVKGLLGPITLRRLKTQIRDGQPIIDLPKRDVFVEHVTLSDEERSIYDAMQTQGKLIISKLVTFTVDHFVSLCVATCNNASNNNNNYNSNINVLHFVLLLTVSTAVLLYCGE